MKRDSKVFEQLGTLLFSSINALTLRLHMCQPQINSHRYIYRFCKNLQVFNMSFIAPETPLNPSVNGLVDPCAIGRSIVFLSRLRPYNNAY